MAIPDPDTFREKETHSFLIKLVIKRCMAQETVSCFPHLLSVSVVWPADSASEHKSQTPMILEDIIQRIAGRDTHCRIENGT